MKKNPELLYDPAKQEAILKYLEKYTNLGNCHFWQCLQPEEKVKCLRYFRLQEMKDKAVRILPDTSKAELFIVLQGSATVLTGKFYSEDTSEEGALFGSIDLFDQLMELHRWRIKRDPEPTFDKLPPLNEPEGVIIGKMAKGCLLRLSLDDFYTNVIRENPKDESALKEQQMRDEAQLIAGLSWEDMTPDDKFYVRVYKKAERVLSPKILVVLDHCRLIPRNARTTAYKYFHTGNPGKELHVHMHDEPNLFVFITGSVRLEVGVPKRKYCDDGEDTMHTVTFKRRGQKSMIMKKNTMPLTSFHGGSVMTLTSDCFTVTEPVVQEADESIYTPKPPTKLLADTMNKAAKLKIMSSSGSLSSSPVPSISRNSSIPGMGWTGPEMTAFTPPKPRTADTTRGRSWDHDDGGPSEDEGARYDLRIVFDAPTDYLQIPISTIDSFLFAIGERDRILMSPFVKAFRKEVAMVRNRIKGRVLGVKSWIEGNTDFFPIEKPLGIISAVGTGEIGKGNKSSNSSSGESMKDSYSPARYTRGSFRQAAVSSSLEGVSEVEDMSEFGTQNSQSKRNSACFYTLRARGFEEVEQTLDSLQVREQPKRKRN